MDNKIRDERKEFEDELSKSYEKSIGKFVREFAQSLFKQGIRDEDPRTDIALLWFWDRVQAHLLFSMRDMTEEERVKIEQEGLQYRSVTNRVNEKRFKIHGHLREPAYKVVRRLLYPPVEIKDRFEWGSATVILISLMKNLMFGAGVGVFAGLTPLRGLILTISPEEYKAEQSVRIGTEGVLRSFPFF